MVHSIVAAILLYLAPTEFPGLQCSNPTGIQSVKVSLCLTTAKQCLHAYNYVHCVKYVYCPHDTEKNSQ